MLIVNPQRGDSLDDCENETFFDSIGLCKQLGDITRNTSCMFRDLFQPTLEEYNGQRVLIAYNSKTDRVAVIKKVS